tara:strand:- start:191 stop:529 length:339 start_codon:yes stop_codon:yes gene_type:complete
MKTKTKKHTCGPWLLEDRENFSGINVVTDDKIICRLPDGASVTGGKCWPEQHANAHLIASAPELYEALKQLTEQSTKELDQNATHDGLQNCNLLANARNAIAHAEGRELGCI